MSSFALPMDLDDQDSFDENDIGVERLNDSVEEERPKSIRFAETIATPFEEPLYPMNYSSSDGSLGLYDDFAQPFGHRSLDEESEGSIDLGIEDASMRESLDPDDSDMDTEEDDTKRNVIWAASGAGLLALLGWGGRHLLSLFQKGGEEDDVAAAAHQLGEGGANAPVPVVDPGASLSGSAANASQSQSFFAAGALPGNGGTGMTAMQ